jgi:UDP-N-acetylglucosamine diphosphorylase/glucosamine-1-phosphate N-acetyltransferase
MNFATVILAAGKGTRMKSDLPKVLHTLSGRPMIHYVIDSVLDTNTDTSSPIVLVVGHQMNLVVDAVSPQYPSVQYVVQEPQLGTAHAVMQSEEILANWSGLVLILSGDVPLIRRETLSKMVDQMNADNNLAVTMMTTILTDATGYGRVMRDEKGDVIGVIEEKDISLDVIRAIREVNAGIYLFQAKYLYPALHRVDNKNKQKEYYLPQVLEIFLQDGLKVGTFNNPDVNETHGINTPDQLKEAEAFLRAHAT